MSVKSPPRLVVERSAAIEIAVFLDHLERVALPVGTFRLDDVDVRDEQDRLGGLRCAGIDGDKAALPFG